VESINQNWKIFKGKLNACYNFANRLGKRMLKGEAEEAIKHN